MASRDKILKDLFELEKIIDTTGNHFTIDDSLIIQRAIALINKLVEQNKHLRWKWKHRHTDIKFG